MTSGEWFGREYEEELAFDRSFKRALFFNFTFYNSGGNDRRSGNCVISDNSHKNDQIMGTILNLIREYYGENWYFWDYFSRFEVVFHGLLSK